METEVDYENEFYAKQVMGLQEVSDLHKAALEEYDSPAPRGKNTGWRTLDEFMTIAPGQLSIVTGMPGSGKSEFLDALVINLIASHGWSFAYCSPENSPSHSHLNKLLEKFIGKPLRDREYQPRFSKQEDFEAKQWLKDKIFWINPEEITFENILLGAKWYVKTRKINGLIIDPYNYIEHERPKGQSETEFVSLILSKLKMFAAVNKIHIWLVAHPAKMEKDKAGKYPPPTPYDISGSAHFANKADICVTVHREIYNEDESIKNTVRINVTKVRFKWIGKIGNTSLYWDYTTGRFSEAGEVLPPAPLQVLRGLKGDKT